MPKNISSPNIIKLRIILISLFSILLVWQVSSRVVNRIRAREITPEEFKRVLTNKEFASLNEKERKEALVYITDRLNHLSLEGRRRIERDNETRKWFEQLAKEERAFVIKETLPRELDLLREEFKKLTPEQRKQAVDNAVKGLKNLSREEKEWVDNLLTAPEGNAIVETALKSYYFDFSYPEKLELSPLIGAVSDELERIANK